MEGEKTQSEALLANLKKDFEVDGDIMGLDSDEISEVKCLGRIVRATPNGLEIEADKRLAVKVVDEANLVGGKGGVELLVMPAALHAAGPAGGCATISSFGSRFPSVSCKDPEGGSKV